MPEGDRVARMLQVAEFGQSSATLSRRSSRPGRRSSRSRTWRCWYTQSSSVSQITAVQSVDAKELEFPSQQAAQFRSTSVALSALS
jgi:hypothetical protein